MYGSTLVNVGPNAVNIKTSKLFLLTSLSDINNDQYLMYFISNWLVIDPAVRFDSNDLPGIRVIIDELFLNFNDFMEGQDENIERSLVNARNLKLSKLGCLVYLRLLFEILLHERADGFHKDRSHHVHQVDHPLKRSLNPDGKV